MTLDNNLQLAENAVLSVEESLSKVFQERSNQVFQKLENILTIFNEEKVSTNHFTTRRLIEMTSRNFFFLKDCQNIF